MEFSPMRWFSDLDMDETSFMSQCDISTLDQVASAFQDDFNEQPNRTLDSESYTNSYTQFEPPMPSVDPVEDLDRSGRPPKALKSSGGKGKASSYGDQVCASVSEASLPTVLSFGDYASENLHNNFGFSIPQGRAATTTKRVASASTTRPPANAQDHIIAERKRREKLSQRLIALSAIVPGVKKIDKASVLGDAIKYVKQLQEKVTDLEKQTAKRTVESVVLVKKSQFPAEEEISSCDEILDGQSQDPNSSSLPEIEVKVSDKSMSLRIHCEKRKGMLVKVLAEIERLNLSILNVSVIPFAGSVVDVTVIAQMEEGFAMTLKELAKELNAAICQLAAT